MKQRVYSFLDKLPFHVLSLLCFVTRHFVVVWYVQSRTRNSKYGLPTNVRIMSKEKPTLPLWVTKQIATLLMLELLKAINTFYHLAKKSLSILRFVVKYSE